MSERTELEFIGDEMSMFATQIIEHTMNRGNNLPHPWRMDDLMNRYRTAFAKAYAKREKEPTNEQ